MRDLCAGANAATKNSRALRGFNPEGPQLKLYFKERENPVGGSRCEAPQKSGGLGRSLTPPIARQWRPRSARPTRHHILTLALAPLNEPEASIFSVPGL